MVGGNGHWVNRNESTPCAVIRLLLPLRARVTPRGACFRLVLLQVTSPAERLQGTTSACVRAALLGE